MKDRLLTMSSFAVLAIANPVGVEVTAVVLYKLPGCKLSCVAEDCVPPSITRTPD